MGGPRPLTGATAINASQPDPSFSIHCPRASLDMGAQGATRSPAPPQHNSTSSLSQRFSLLSSSPANSSRSQPRIPNMGAPLVGASAVDSAQHDLPDLPPQNRRPSPEDTRGRRASRRQAASSSPADTVHAIAPTAANVSSVSDVNQLFNLIHSTAAPNCSQQSVSDEAPALSPVISQSYISLLATSTRLNQPRHQRPGRFPLSYPKAPLPDPAPPPYLEYKLQAVYYGDGGAHLRHGAFAMLKHTPTRSSILAVKVESATNNITEFKALEASLDDSVKNGHSSILYVTDSSLVFDFLIGTNNVTLSHLKVIIDNIKLLMKRIDFIYASKVFSHRKDSVIGNVVADALCTWAMNTTREAPLIMLLTGNSLASRLLTLNKSLPGVQALSDTSKELCAICLKCRDHNHASCKVRDLVVSDPKSLHSCLACLSSEHDANQCPLYLDRKSCPTLAKGNKTAPLLQNINLQNIEDVDFDSAIFPSHQNRIQFMDYFETIFSTFYFGKTDRQQSAAEKALLSWKEHYHFHEHSIFRHRQRAASSAADPGNNSNPEHLDPQEQMANRAMKAAALGTKARIADVSKALRSAPPIPLTDEIEEMLKALHPPAKSDPVHFEPKPLQGFTVSRHAVARMIMSRSPLSHAGTLGLDYDILQHYCSWSYGLESRDNPDPRWTLFCELIAKIMSGNATLMSGMLHDIFGAFFNKNADKPGADLSIRNIGIEETLMRIPAALVFELVIEDALDRNFLTYYDFGAGRKAGVEIFAKIAAMASINGAIIAVMDVKRAFNNLRRVDIKNAVEDFGNPLLTAFVHFMFERDPVVTFKDRITGKTLTCTYWEGILQGNPLSVFIFALTIAFILRPLRALYKNQLTVASAYVDDMNLISNPSQAHAYPGMLAHFVRTFNDHGLEFDLSDSAKTSVYTAKPLPNRTRNQLAAMGFRCQTEGIAPCKNPVGSPAFLKTFVTKAIAKLKTRYDAFDLLWTAMLNVDAKKKKPTKHTHEYFMNLVRLSFLSMPIYTLRALKPSICEPYKLAASLLAESLLSRIFPQPCFLPPSTLGLPPPQGISFAVMKELSLRIRWLPLSLGGLSLRYPSSTGNIAYVASCIDCAGAMARAARDLGFNFSLRIFEEFGLAVAAIHEQIPTFTDDVWEELQQTAGSSYVTSQQQITRSLNSHEITSIADALKPDPIYYFAFKARTDALQDQVSWVFNPKLRSAHSIGALDDSDFRRAIQIATLYPIFPEPRKCEHRGCKGVLDPVGLHLLQCAGTHYSIIHDSVKHAVAQRFRSFMTSQLASLSVHVEQPVRRFAPLRNIGQPEGIVAVADIVLILSGSVQQDILITDVVSSLAHTPNKREGFYFDLNQASREKLSKYYKYNIANDRFHPLSVGRTNILSHHTLRFCDLAASYFPKQLNVYDKLRATFSRSITVGVAITLSEAVRRLQLAVSNSVAFSMVPQMSSPKASRASAHALGHVQQVHSARLQAASHLLRSYASTRTLHDSCVPAGAPLSRVEERRPWERDVIAA